MLILKKKQKNTLPIVLSCNYAIHYKLVREERLFSEISKPILIIIVFKLICIVASVLSRFAVLRSTVYFLTPVQNKIKGFYRKVRDRTGVRYTVSLSPVLHHLRRTATPKFI